MGADWLSFLETLLFTWWIRQQLKFRLFCAIMTSQAPWWRLQEWGLLLHDQICIINFQMCHISCIVCNFFNSIFFLLIISAIIFVCLYIYVKRKNWSPIYVCIMGVPFWNAACFPWRMFINIIFNIIYCKECYKEEWMEMAVWLPWKLIL